METISDDSDLRISRRIRLEREARGWSLAQAADAAGVSKAMISRIERGEASPTAALLARIAAGFGLTLAGLLLRAEEDRGRLVRREEQSEWTDPGTGYVRRQVMARPDHPVELVEVALPAGAQVAFPASTYALIRQVVWVQEGELSVSEGGEAHVLRPGDCLAFGAPSDVVLANDGQAVCRYVVIISRR